MRYWLTNPKTGKSYLTYELSASLSLVSKYKKGSISCTTRTVCETGVSWECVSFRFDLPSGEIIIREAKSVLAAKRAITRLMRCAGMRDTQGR
jgi:hypothetical protein